MSSRALFLQSQVARGVPGAPRAVCLVTQDVAGPMLNGGIGTAFRNLAAKLVQQGHSVTILYALGPVVHEQSRKTFYEWQVEYRDTYGVRLLSVKQRPAHLYDSTVAVRRAYEVFMWLEEHESEFDVVHFHEWQGTGFFCLLAKQQQLRFQHTLLVVQTHSPSAWALEGNEELPGEFDFLDVDFMERKSVQMADVLLSPSQYMLAWLQQRGWVLPAASFVQPNCMLSVLDTEPYASKCEDARREFVFFGRLEPRKGVFVFLKAAQLMLAAQSESGVKVTFTLLGKEVPTYISEVDAQRHNLSATFNTRVELISGMTPEDAAAYLTADGCRVAVMPSKFDNLPYVVMESLAHRVSFISSNAGGTVELIHPDYVHASTFTPHSALVLLAKFQEVVRNGPPGGRFHPFYESVDAVWGAWHAQVMTDVAHRPPSFPRGRPLISVIMTTYNREHSILQQAINSLLQQDFPASQFEVIMVDDGSTTPTTHLFERTFKERKWKILKITNMFLGAARNEGVKASRGRWLLFMDDDNVAKQDELRTFANVYALGRADILTCLLDEFSTPEPPPTATQTTFRWIHVSNVQASWMHNTLGDANFFISRAVFDQLGGFFTHRLAYEDWELLIRAQLAGYRIEVVPLSLFWKRKSETSMLHTQDAHASLVAALQPFVQNLPGNVGTGLLLAKALLQSSQDATTSFLWDSLIDFRLLQGHRNTFFCIRVRGAANRTTDFTRVSLTGATRGEDAIWIDAPSFGALSFGRSLLHPSIVDGFAVDAVKVWRSNTEGGIMVSGEILKPGNGGDGVLFELFIDGVLHRSAKITDNSPRHTFSHTAFVKVGTEIAFSANALSSDLYDALWTHFTIGARPVVAEAHMPPPLEPTVPARCDFVAPGVCGPKLFIVGALNCGFGTLAKALTQHPSIVPPLDGDGFDVFDIRSSSTAAAFKAILPPTDWVFNVFFYVNPQYFTSFAAAANLRLALPRATVIVAVCDPVERLWSHYWHVHGRTDELQLSPDFKLPFREFVQQSVLQNDTHGVLSIGNYAKHISMWTSLFGTNNVLLWNWTRYRNHPGAVMLDIFEGAQLPPFWTNDALDESHEAHPHVSEMDLDARAALDAYYADVS